MGARRSSGTLRLNCGVDTVPAARQVWFAEAGVRIRRWPAGLASRGLAARHPAVPAARRGGERRRDDGDRQEHGRDVLDAAWSRAAGRLGGEGVDFGWVGRAVAAPVLCGGPVLTGVGAGRHGPVGPGGGRGLGPPGRRAAAGRDGRAGGASGGRRPRPAAGYRRRPRSRPSPPGVPWCLPWTRLGAPSSPGSGDSSRRPPPAAGRLASQTALWRPGCQFTSRRL
jgi:hypothetical protein